MAMTYNNIAGILSDQKRYSEAEEYLNRAYKILQEKGTKNTFVYCVNASVYRLLMQAVLIRLSSNYILLVPILLSR